MCVSLQIPKELIDAYKSGAKHPISSLNEYCALRRLAVSFREDAVLTYMATHKFASVCKVDGKEYPQGVGPTKKDAKTQAARNAFNIILGFVNEEEEDDDGIP